MKRLLGIISCFFVLYAVVALAWSSCKQISFESDHHSHRSAPVHAHDHHQASDHTHSDNAVIHCPSLSQFVPAASFAVKTDSEEKRVLDSFGAEFASRFNDPEFNPLIHDPPTLIRSSTISFHLFFSVLRI